jgi:hypothetical protein
MTATSPISSPLSIPIIVHTILQIRKVKGDQWFILRLNRLEAEKLQANIPVMILSQQ